MASAKEVEDIRVDAGHFLELAAHGCLPGASSGARRAKALADTIVDHVPGLDHRAVQGLIAFIKFTQRNPSTAAELY